MLEKKLISRYGVCATVALALVHRKPGNFPARNTRVVNLGLGVKSFCRTVGGDSRASSKRGGEGMFRDTSHAFLSLIL